MPTNTRYFAAGVLSAVIWGFFSIPLRNLSAYPAQEILYYRIFTSLLVLSVVVLFLRRQPLKDDIQYLRSLSAYGRRSVFFQILGATLLLVGNWYTFIYTINNVSLKAGAFAYMVCPLITAFGGFLILKEYLTPLKLWALGIAFVSIVLLATGSFVEVMWSVVIAALYAFYLILQRKMQRLDKLNVLAVQICFAVIVLLPFYLFDHGNVPSEAFFWGNIILIAVLFTIIPLFLSLYALIGIPSSTLGIMIYINPIIAFAVAVWYFEEPIERHQLYAYMLLLFAVILFNWNVIKGIFTAKRKIA